MRARAFADRTGAGRALARRLLDAALVPPLVVLALPRGGVPVAAQVAAEVACALGVPLDPLLVRKIGAPWQPEPALAALVDGDAPDIVVDEPTRRMCGVERDYIGEQADLEMQEIERRRRIYLAGRAPVPAAGATMIVIDDGVATGTTIREAMQALRRRHAARLVPAVPVAPADSVAEWRAGADEVICLAQPAPFHAIGLRYGDFRRVSDDEVPALRAAGPAAPAAAN